jgi:hypothetical protein
MRYAFYAIYTLSTIGICLSVVYDNFALAAFCFIACIIGVIKEVEMDRGTWPVVGSDDYKKIVDKLQDAIIEGKAKHYENRTRK